MEETSGCGLVSLRIRNLRSLARLDLEFEGAWERLAVAGGNGSGKTTLLEALYLLARGRTFRGRKAGAITTHGADRTLIEGRMRDGGVTGEGVVRVEYRSGRAERTWNGVVLNGGSPTASPLRVKLIGENPQILLEGEPGLRRGFLDWNVFHVEPGFGAVRNRFRRVWLQRNAALRSGDGRCREWDDLFVELGERLTAARTRFLDSWRGHFDTLRSGFSFLDGVELTFDRGWSPAQDLATQLAVGHPRDQQRGQTLVGPHRADLALTVDGRPLALSRGQAKVAVCLLQMAAERVHRAWGLVPALWLLDDVDSELDGETRDALVALFDTWAVPRVSTQIGNGPVVVARPAPVVGGLFHVEHSQNMASGVPLTASATNP